MTSKTFDCGEMKRQGSKRVYDAIKGMSREEEIAYWRKRTEEMRREVADKRQPEDGPR